MPMPFDDRYRIESLCFNEGTKFEPSKLTVIIGPNNAGKSRVLKDVVEHTTERNPSPCVLVPTLEVHRPSSYDIFAEQNEFQTVERRGSQYLYAIDTELLKEFDVQFGYEEHEYKAWFSNPSNITSRGFASYFGTAAIVFLSTANRLTLVTTGPSPGRDGEAKSLLQVLYNAGSNADNTLSNLVEKTFSQMIKLDISLPQKLVIRVGKDFSRVPPDPRDARPLLQQYPTLDDQGDGLRSFVGIATALLFLKRSVFLIDEPEAFLHPPQAYQMGAFISDQANSSRQIIVATHSADVLRGILSVNHEANIIRLDRIQNTSLVKELDTARLKEVVGNPLLSSARVLDGLFYSGAVVVEADADVRFYQAACNKLGMGMDLHFVNADNKQTVPGIVELYRNMGVRSVGIVDFDVINDPAELRVSLKTFGFSDLEIDEVMVQQEIIAKEVKDASPKERVQATRSKLDELVALMDQTAARSYPSDGERQVDEERLLRRLESRFRGLAKSSRAWEQLKQNGRGGLSSSSATAFDQIAHACAQKGLFILPSGELESALIDHGIKWQDNKREWIRSTLQLVPSLQVDESKVLWGFLSQIKDYLSTTRNIDVAGCIE